MNRQDRYKIKAIAKAFGDEVFETAMQISIPAWGRRFWFGVTDGVEYIRLVDDIEIA